MQEGKLLALKEEAMMQLQHRVTEGRTKNTESLSPT